MKTPEILPLECLLINYIPDGVLFVGADRRIVYANSKAAELAGRDISDLCGKDFLECHPVKKRKEVLKVCQELKENPDKVVKRELNLNGCIYEVNYRAVFYQGSYIGILATSRDITETRRLMSEIEEASIRDGLTGLYNARYFFKQLKVELKRAQRQRYTLSLLVIDVDDFKKYNDNFGHLEGDKALKRIGKLVSKVIRKGVDLAARYGGDEFLILLVDAGKEVAEKVAFRLEELFEKENLPFINLTMGIATLRPVDSWRSFFRRADNDLYAKKKAKKRGRRN